MTYTIIEWDDEAQAQRERAATEQESADIEARKNAINLPTEDDYVTAVQAKLDATAQERNYDSILSACTYVGSTVDKFNAEGIALRNWRDAVWAACYERMAEVQAGTLAQPTVAGLIAMLPALTWPA